MKSKVKNIVINTIKNNMVLFRSFNSIYLFGSVLYDEKTPNDIDLLLIYSKYSNNINDELTVISRVLENTCGLYVDFTVLSEVEEKEICFLNRIYPSYIKLK